MATVDARLPRDCFCKGGARERIPKHSQLISLVYDNVLPVRGI